jgi:uncharacterized protein
MGLRGFHSNNCIEKATTTFSNIIDLFPINNEKNYNFIFHGGEPTLLGINFFSTCYEKASEAESLKDINIKKCIQTNLYNVPIKLLKNLKKMNYEVSTSLDGTQNAHDTFRKDKNGNASFQRVVENVKRAQDIGFQVNAVCCVSKLNLYSVDEMYQFFNSMNISPKFNYLEFESNSLSREMKITPKEYAKFIINMSTVWLQDSDSNIDIMPISDMLSTLVNEFSESCIHSKDCQKQFVCIGPSGDVWPCGKCYGIKEFYLGKISEQKNGLLSYDMRRSKFGKSIDLPKTCKKCEHLKFCNGLCPYDLFAENNSFRIKSKWCAAYKLLWPYFENTAAQYQMKQLSV